MQRTIVIRVAATAITLCLATSVGLSNVITRTYDASLGTDPSAQGLTLHDSGGAGSHSVQGGVLDIGPTTTGGYYYWHREDTVLDFTEGLILEARIRVITGPYYSGDGGRTPFGFSASDNEGREFDVWVGADRVFIQNQNNVLGAGPYSLDTTDDFHTFRLIVESDTGFLFIDDGTTPVLTLGVGPTGQHEHNRASFGDGTRWLGGETLLTHFSYTNVPETGDAGPACPGRSWDASPAT